MNANDIGLLRSLDVNLHVQRAVAFAARPKSTNYNDDDDKEDEDDDPLGRHLPPAPRSTCGLLKYRNRCTVCDGRANRLFVRCDSRGRWYHKDCVESHFNVHVPQRAIDNEDERWFCPQCQMFCCAPRGHNPLACVVCGSRQPCNMCLPGAAKVQAPCPHWIIAVLEVADFTRSASA